MDAPQATNLLCKVPSDEAPALWRQIEAYVYQANAFTGQKFHVKHWLMKILAEQADLWVTPDLTAVLIGEALQFPAARIYSISLIGGEGGDDWAAYEKQIEARAREIGCGEIEALARPGWKNIGKACGYHVAHWVFRKELDDGRQ